MSRADELDAKRAAVKSVARDLVKNSGGSVSYDQALRRVSNAVESGDRKRENGNR